MSIPLDRKSKEKKILLKLKYVKIKIGLRLVISISISQKTAAKNLFCIHLPYFHDLWNTLHLCKQLTLLTLRYRIRVPVRLFILGWKFTLYALISSCTFINFGNQISKFSVFKSEMKLYLQGVIETVKIMNDFSPCTFISSCMLIWISKIVCLYA